MIKTLMSQRKEKPLSPTTLKVKNNFKVLTVMKSTSHLTNHGQRKLIVDPATKRVKSSAPAATGNAYNAPPQLLHAPSSSQSYFTCQYLIKAFDNKKSYILSRNTEYLHLHNKSTRDCSSQSNACI